MPMTASKIMRPKQWSTWTGQEGWTGDLEVAREGRVCPYSWVQVARRDSREGGGDGMCAIL